MDKLLDDFIKEWRKENNTEDAVYSAYHYDAMIAFAKLYAQQQVKNTVDLGSVSQQRELLLAFAKHQRDWGNTALTKEMHEKEVEHFLKSNNCG